MNKIIFALSIIASASVGYWAGKNNNISDASVYSTAPSMQASVKAPAIATNSLAENNIQQAEVVVSDKEESLSNSTSSIVGQSAQHQIDAIKAEYEFKQRSEAFTNWLAKNQETKPWFDLGMEMRGRFDAEEIDHGWASIEEGHIQSLFSQEQALAGTALKSTSCKSTQCQITISVMDQDHANEMAMTISRVLGGEKAAQIIIDNRAQQGETIFYVSRNEKGFEFN
jgi:hypothetical protein